MPGSPLCHPCGSSLRRSPRFAVKGVTVESGFMHAGAAVRLVHNLKYRRSLRAGRILAEAMAERLDPSASVLVPVPRSFIRRVSYGVDQALVLAEEVSKISGVEVLDALAAPIWWRRRAGAARKDRREIDFGRKRDLPDGAVLIDDVFTTGATALSAIAALGTCRISVLVATSVCKMVSGSRTASEPGRWRDAVA